MSHQSLNSVKPEFAHGEAEEIIRTTRAAYRAVETKSSAGDTRAAANARRKADALLTALQQRLEWVLDRAIKKYIGFASPVDREEAHRRLQLSILDAARDLRDTPSNAHWERKFNMCVKHRALDIRRSLQGRYGFGDTGYQEISFSTGENSDGMVSGSPIEERLPDMTAEAQMEAVLSREVLNIVIAGLGGKERHHLSLWWRQYAGETWEEIAASENIKADTARKRAQAVLGLVRKALLA